MPTWFSEILHSDFRQSLKAKKVIYSGKTPFQKVRIFDNGQFGRVLMLDGVVQTTEGDEFIYHEMMAHVPLFSHPNARRVLIIGGGDGGVLREVLKHPVEEVTLVELDEKVVSLSKRYLKSICQTAFTDSRTRIRIEDGAKFVTNQAYPFDIVVIDSTDPIGPGKVLFSRKFYQDVKKLLGSSGILIRQTGSTFLQPEEWVDNFHLAASFFTEVHPLVIAVPTYVGGFFNLLFASDRIDPLALDLTMLKARYGELQFKTRYYNPEIHQSCFRLPEYMRSRLPTAELSEAKRG